MSSRVLAIQRSASQHASKSPWSVRERASRVDRFSGVERTAAPEGCLPSDLRAESASEASGRAF